MRLRRTRPPATWRRPTTLVAPSRRWRPRTRMRANSGKPTADRSCETAARVDRAPFPAQILAHGPVQVQSASAKLRKLALGTTEWYDEEPDSDDGGYGVPVHVPGLMKPRFPELKEQVAEVKELLGTVLSPFLEHDSQVTVIVDGLDRLIEPTRFREFAEQDLRAVRGMQVTVIVAAPLLLWYDNSRFLQDYFDVVRHIPAAAIDPKESGFLKAILKRRGADELMSAASLNDICRSSGGVLRDLLELAQSAAQYAYWDAENRIGKQHVRAAIRQLGHRYLAGVGTTRTRLI